MGVFAALIAWAGNGARAADLVVNGVVVDPSALRGVRLTDATVTVDAAGNIVVSAPGFVAEPRRTVPPTPTPASGVPAAKWWLATEDGGSVGHVVEVEINGKRVQTIRSGDAQRIVDIGGWLRPGSNAIRVRSVSTSAQGGTLYVYVSTGSDQSGTVVMDSPRIQFGLGATRSGEYVRDYTLDVVP